MKTRYTAIAAPALAAVILASLAPTAALAQRPIPQGIFACHVTTENRAEGIAIVQAKSLEDASRAALSGMAWETPEVSGTVVDVIECVAHPADRLESREMNTLLASLPL
jgi:hypothetical protein